MGRRRFPAGPVVSFRAGFAYCRESHAILGLFVRVEPDADYQAELLKALGDSWELRIARSQIESSRRSARERAPPKV